MPETYTTVCSTCGSEYLVTKIKLLSRDKDKIDCDVCGKELFNWNGAVMYEANLLKRGNWPKKA
jgi:hypothetical protein